MTDDRTAGTAELEQVAPGSQAYALVADPSKKWTLDDLLEMLAGAAAQPREVPAPAAAEEVTITDELREALRQLPEVFGGVVPTEPRKLEQAELARITRERAAIARVVTALGKRDKSIDETVRNHMDAEAREQGITEPVVSEGVAKGHVLAAQKGVPFSVAVPGFEDGWQQRLVKGRSEMQFALLADLLLAGTITRAEYLAVTTEVRVIDEDKVRKMVRKAPKRFLAIVRAATVRKPDTASLVPPKK
jgi:hypothetical protein